MTDAVAGVTAMDTNGFTTVRVAEPVMVPEVADIVVVPAAILVARPEVLTVAIDGLDDSQFAAVVRFWVDPSLYEPVAANCWVDPALMDGLPGVTEMDTKVFVVPPPPDDPPEPPQATMKHTPTSNNDHNAFFIPTPPGHSCP